MIRHNYAALCAYVETAVESLVAMCEPNDYFTVNTSKGTIQLRRAVSSDASVPKAVDRQTRDRQVRLESISVPSSLLRIFRRVILPNRFTYDYTVVTMDRTSTNEECAANVILRMSPFAMLLNSSITGYNSFTTIYNQYVNKREIAGTHLEYETIGKMQESFAHLMLCARSMYALTNSDSRRALDVDALLGAAINVRCVRPVAVTATGSDAGHGRQCTYATGV